MLLRASPDGRYLAQVAATVGGRDAIAGIFDLETGSLVFDPVRFGRTNDSEFQSATFGPDGRYLFITRFKDGELVAIDAQTGETHVALAGVAPASADARRERGRRRRGVEQSHRGRHNEQGVVTILDAGTFEIENTLTAPFSVTTFRAVGDGAKVIGNGFEGVFLLDVDTASIEWMHPDSSLSCVLAAVVVSSAVRSTVPTSSAVSSSAGPRRGKSAAHARRTERPQRPTVVRSRRNRTGGLRR